MEDRWRRTGRGGGQMEEEDKCKTGVGTYHAGSELGGVVIDVSHMYDSHTLAGQSQARHVTHL